MLISINRNVRYANIDGLRAYAVLLVFIEHFMGGVLTEYFHFPVQSLQNPTSLIMKFLVYLSDGNQGVDIFFIISGFLISRMVFSYERKFNYKLFVKNRIKRIYPSFFISLVVCALADHFLFGWLWSSKEFLKDLFFLNAIPGLVTIPYNHVSWSLGYEFFFYLVLPFVLLIRYLLNIYLPVKNFSNVISGLIVLFIAIFVLPTTGYIRLLALFSGSLIGAFRDEDLSKFSKRIPFFAALLFYLSIGIINHTVGFYSYKVYYEFLIIAIMLIFIKVVYGGGSINSIFGDKYVRSIGTLSYSIYLYHSIIISIVFYFLTPNMIRNEATIFVLYNFVFAIALTLFIAYFNYIVVEKRYFKTR